MAVKKEKVTKEISTKEIKKAKAILDETNKPEVIEKSKFLKCPFCGEISKELNGKDPTSSWCQGCGKCYPAVWREE